VRRTSSPLFSLQDEVNRLFNDFFSDSQPSTTASKTLAPVMDVQETAKDLRITAELPGISEDNVEIAISDGYLTIKGDKLEEKAEGEEAGQYYRRERSFGSFHRALALPDAADGEKTEASFKNGVLEIRIPKKEQANKTHKVKIKAA